MYACARIPHPLGELISTLTVGFNTLNRFSGSLHFLPLAQKSSTGQFQDQSDGHGQRHCDRANARREQQSELQAVTASRVLVMEGDVAAHPQAAVLSSAQ